MAAHGVRANSSALRVLVADRELLLRWSIAETLSGLGHTVVTLADCASALRAVQASAEPFDCALLECGLRGTHDFSTLVAIRRISPQTSVVLLTTLDAHTLANTARRLGACDVVTKPFDMNTLEPLLCRALTWRAN
jgi:DNA-binding NtrC family response regulator